MIMSLNTLYRTYSYLTLNKSVFLSKRSLFIRTQDTPNPLSIKFLPGKTLTSTSLDFPSFRTAQRSPLARRLFKINGVTSVFVGTDFISVNITDSSEWSLVKPDVFAAIQEFITANEPILIESNETSTLSNDTTILPEDSETVAMIKELIETRIRPTVQEDGGDIIYRGFEDGIVSLEMCGSCKGCPSSAVTLKNGIEVF